MHTFSPYAFIHHTGVAWAFIPLDCMSTPSQLRVSMLPCVDCTSTTGFEQAYLFLTSQLEYGSGKKICPAVTQILCTTAKFHHCLAASKAHHFYISRSSPTKHHTSFLEAKRLFSLSIFDDSKHSQVKATAHYLPQTAWQRSLIPAVLPQAPKRPVRWGQVWLERAPARLCTYRSPWTVHLTSGSERSTSPPFWNYENKYHYIKVTCLTHQCCIKLFICLQTLATLTLLLTMNCRVRIFPLYFPLRSYLKPSDRFVQPSSSLMHHVSS